MFDYPIRTLCIPGARVQNDRKEFYSQLMSAMKTENPDQIVLHLGSNDVYGDVESTLRSYRFLIENLLLEFESLQIGICGILPRAVNHYESTYWNMSALPRLQRDVEKLNAGIQSLTGGYSRCFFIDYAKLFQPAVHLGRDGLHVNRNGAFILKMTLENYLAERQKCVTYMNATLLSPVQVPDGESVSPKMTYAEVVRLSVPSSDTRNRPFDKDVDHQNSSRTPSKRKRLCLAGARRTIKKRSQRKSRGTYKTGYSIKRNEIVLDVTDDVAVILSSSVICTFYQTDTTKQPVESLQVKQSKKTAGTKKEKKSTYKCPVCPVTCSREDFLIDHVICRHAKKGQTHLVKEISLKVPKTEEPVEELRSSFDENDKHIHDIAYGSVNIESYEGDCIIPSRTEFAESDELECSIPTIEFAESGELEFSIPTIEFAEIGETEFSIPPTIELAETDEMESCSPIRIEFSLPTVKVLASKCWKNFKRFILHLCGDVERNPGPTMLTCKWEQCTENKFTDVRLLAQHVISHISPGIVCQWEECVYCCPNDQYKLEIHVLKHIYLEQFAFHSIEEWGRALPSGQFSETCTDLHLCPSNLKMKLNLPLLDEEFSMPSQYPYTVRDHQLFLLQLKTKNPENYERLLSVFHQKVETMSEDTTASQSGTEPSTSTSGNTTELTIQGIDPLAILNSNMTRSSQHVIVTNRPELTGTNQSTVKFRLQDETEIVTRKYISGNSKKRKHAASSIQKFNDENMTGNDLITNLNICRQAILVEHNIITKLQDMKFLDPKNKFLSSFEEAAINMSTYPDCSEGVFIFSIFDIEIENHNAPVHYIRYIESGYYKHFMEETFLEVICQTLGILQDNVFLCNILTGGDQQRMLIGKKNKDLRKSRIRPDKIYGNNLKSLKSRRQQLCEKVKDFCDIELTACFVHTARHGYKVNIDSDAGDGLYFSSNNELFHTETIQNKILHYPEVKNAEVSEKFSDDFMKPLPACNVNNLCYKSCMINFLSNDHNRFLGNENLRYPYRFSTSPKATSLRNRVLYLYKNNQLNELKTIYSSFQQVDQNQEIINNENMNDSNGEPKTKRTRTFIPRKKILTKEMVLQTITGQNVENMFKKVNLYDNYKKNLLQNRSFIIQVYDDVKVIAIMNDYDDESGEFRSSDYVKTSRDLFENGYFYTCTCRIYCTLLESLDNNMQQYDALDENGIKCMHCRFLHQEVSPNLHRDEQATLTNIQEVIQDALLYKDRKIIELQTARPGTKKFSILIDDDISVVHLTFNSRLQRYVVSCLNGLCKSKKGCKKNVDCLNTDQNLCAHLSELKKAPHFWTEFIKPEAAVNTENDENIQLIDQEIEEITGNDIEEEIPALNPSDSNFDVTSGLWSFPCVSRHKPRKQQDPNLVQNIQHRYISGALNLNNVENGCIKGQHFIPDIPTSVCPCGAGWTSNQQLNGVTTFSRVLTVFTKIAPVQCQVYSRSCVNEASPCKKDWDEGDKECVHVVTRDTAAGDEIGWAFVNQVLSTKITFSAFCDLKTKDYKECNPNFRSFMDSSVFIKWWFSWASNMKIDFRKPCPICKFRPKQLACDGTKVGIGFRHASFEEISKPDNPDNILPTIHRRMARCFLFDRVGDKEQLTTARHHLNYLAKLNLDKIPPQEILSGEDTQQRDNILLEILDNSVRPSFGRFLNDMPDVEKISYALILHMLCTTAPVISLIPYSYLNDLTELLDHISGININAAGNGFYNRKMYEMREYAPELRDLIASSMLSHADPQGNNFIPDDIIAFIRYLIKCVADMEITQPDPANPQPGTYNPAKYGRAYYFSETGEKLRPVRKFTIDGEKRKNPAYDDPPLPHDNCEKYFSKTQISARGTSTLFLWFCPSHGHCYGFHMTNAEGRKDPSASLYSHLEHPPTDIFYDFACNLQEYCLNRESGYYRCVRFFHDIFHGYSHKCSCAYRSSRLQGFDTINSEICEQFNSFIQCIKSSARQMTQEHFCFYLQFFLHEWNERKREKYQKRIAVALAGAP